MNNVSKFGSISIKLFTLCLLVGTWCCVEIRSIYAQTDAFLISPYYGTQSVNQDYSSGHPAHDYSLNYTQVLAAASGTIQRVQWYDNRVVAKG